MTKDQTIALIKAIQQTAIFLGKSMMETKVPNASIADDIDVLDSAIDEIIADIPDDTSDNNNTPDDNNPDNDDT